MGEGPHRGAGRTRWRLMRRVAPCLLALPAALVGCSDTAGPALALAEESCRYPAPDAPNFDPQAADLALLEQLATTARERSRLADAAAEGDGRWEPLADAARALAAYADTIVGIRRSGGSVADELPAEVWDQVKYASDAFILECRTALSEAPG